MVIPDVSFYYMINQIHTKQGHFKHFKKLYFTCHKKTGKNRGTQPIILAQQSPIFFFFYYLNLIIGYLNKWVIDISI